jgi:hypothetical protein
MDDQGITKAVANQLATELTQTLKAFAEARGLLFRARTLRYDSSMIRGGFTFQPKTVGAKPVAQHEFEQHAMLFGLLPTDWGRSFISKGRRYTICGLQLGAAKYPIKARTAAGKVLRWKPEAIRTLLLPRKERGNGDSAIQA